MESDIHYILEKLNDSSLLDTLLKELNDSIHNSKRIDITRRLGPKREELSKVLPITIVYSIIFFTGIIGNMCTCLVIAKNKYMRTTTNLYLFNLAVADLLVLVLGLPFEIYKFWSAYPWIFGEAFCYLRNMAAETTTCASVLTITAFTIERYVAFCHSSRAPSISNLGRVAKIIVYIWVLSGLLAIPLTMQFGIVYLRDGRNMSIEESAQCAVKRNDQTNPLFGISAFLFFILPMSIISIMYVFIAHAIHRSTLQRNSFDSIVEGEGYPGCFPGDRQTQARKAVVKMLVAVVVAFFVCWAPFHIQRLMALYVKKWTKPLRRVENIIFYISGVLYYFSSTINPILYNTMSIKFRQAFKTTLLNLCKSRRNNQRQTRAIFYRYTFKGRKDAFNLARNAKCCLDTHRTCTPQCICPVPSSSNYTSGYHKNNITSNPQDDIQMKVVVVDINKSHQITSINRPDSTLQPTANQKSITALPVTEV